MRIGVNTLFLIPGEVGGSETYLRQVLRHMVPASFSDEFVLFTNRENNFVLKEDLKDSGNVEFELLDFNASNRYARIIREQSELPSRARKAKVDVLWSPGYTAAVLCPCPQVVSILDMQYKTHRDDLSFLAWLTTDILVRLAARRCDRVIAISEFSKSEIVKHTSAGAEKVVVTPLAADSAFGEVGDREVRGKVVRDLVGGDGPYILSVANTYPHKNLHQLVESFGDLMDKIDHRLVIVGKPRRGEKQFQSAIAGLSDAGKIKRITGMDRDELISLYQSADLFVFPSLYEGFGLPVLEAMTAGVPVITTRNASIPEVGGDNVVYYGPGMRGDLSRKIQQVLAWSGDERDKWCKKARARAEGFTWANTASITMETLRIS